MAKTLIVFGYGTGISKAVAEKFGAEGFSIALVARNADKLASAAKELEGKGLKASAIKADAGDAKSVADAVEKARALGPNFGPIAAIHWNAYAGEAGDLLAADANAIHRALDVATIGLLAAVKAAHADLKSQKGAVLVTNGGFALSDPKVDAACVQFGSMGLGLANAAKHKLVGMLAKKLEPDGVFVGEVMVMGTVKGTAWDQGNATIDAKTIGAKFWELQSLRKDTFATVA